MCFMGLRFSDSGEHVSTFNTVLFKQAVWDDLSFVTWCVIQQVAGDSTLWSLRHGHDQQHYSNRMWCLNDTQLILRAPNWAKKISPTSFHHYNHQPDCWYKAGWNQVFMMFTQNSDPHIQIHQIRKHFFWMDFGEHMQAVGSTYSFSLTGVVLGVILLL